MCIKHIIKIFVLSCSKEFICQFVVVSAVYLSHSFLRLNFFYSSLRFTSELRNWGGHTQIYHMPPGMHCLPYYKHYPKSKKSVVHLLEFNLQWHIIIKIHNLHYGSLVFLHSVSLDKCIMTCINHYGIIQNVFTALKILCAPPIIPPTPGPRPPLIFFNCFHSFTFSGMSYSSNYTLRSLFRWPSFT